MANSQPSPYFTDKSYDVLKFIALVLLPAVGALYFGLAQIWGLPNAEEVVGTITVIDTFLGVILKLSSNAYNDSDARYDGTLDVTETERGKAFMLNLDSDPEDLPGKRSVEFKINKSSDVDINPNY